MHSTFCFPKLWGGLHMVVVTATESRSNERTVYVPLREDGMAHRSYISPDHKWVLLTEMASGWKPCRLVPFDGSSNGKKVGPTGECTYAAWSPDGKWMYFSSSVSGAYHIWRQQFPDGSPEQITISPNEEEGIAIAPDGHSFITSVGTRQSTIWLHDSRGEQQVSFERFSNRTAFSHDSKKVYYLGQRETPSLNTVSELWMADVQTFTRERLLPGFSIFGYDISADGTRIVFSGTDDHAKARELARLAGMEDTPRSLFQYQTTKTRSILVRLPTLFFA
jgi:eukaryotic-like serine/threonine-protein kinase